MTASLGAVVEGVAPRDPDLDMAAIHRALLDHEVIFFRGVHLTPDEHLDFGRRFGTSSVFPVARLMGSTEPTMTVIEDGPDSPNVADEWHTDVTWTPEAPKCALLCMEEIPATGGDTLWASATRAYDTLSPAMQTFLAGLTGVLDNEGFIRNLIIKVGDPNHELVGQLRREYPPVNHPLIRTHPRPESVR